MSNKENWFKHGFFSLSQRFSAIVFGFGGFYILVRMLDKQAFGTWALFVSVTAFIEVARNGLVQNAQIKFTTDADEKSFPVILRAAFALNIILTAISSMLLLVLSPWMAVLWKAPELVDLFRLYIFTTIALIPFTQFGYLQQSRLDFKGLFYATFFRQGIFFFGILFSFLLNIQIGLNQLVWMSTIAALLGSFVAWISVRKVLVLSASTHWKTVLELFKYGRYVFGTNVSAMLFSSMDQFMLGALMSTSSVAIYNTAFRLSNLLDVPISTISALMFPHAAKKASNGDKAEIQYLYEKSTGISMALVIPAIAIGMLFPELIIEIIAGKSYTEAANVLRIILLYSLIMPFQRQFGTILDATGHPQINFYSLMGSAILNLILNYLFIGWFGLIGAALGTFSSLLITFFWNEFILYKMFGIQCWNVAKYIPPFYKEVFLKIKTFVA